MADVYFKLDCTVHLTERELKLICFGLSGSLKRPEDIQEARDLYARLLRAQSVRLGEQLTKINGTIVRNEGSLEPLPVQELKKE